MSDDNAAYLKALATHFVQRDWNYTRLNDIKHIRYKGDYSGYKHLYKRVLRLLCRRFKSANMWKSSTKTDESWYCRLYWTVVGWYATALVTLRPDKHRPDGVLDGGSVITYWEETGEYVQLVQPSVGEMLADFLLECPEHPHAQKILTELTRLVDNYGARCKNGEVDGRVRGTDE